MCWRCLPSISYLVHQPVERAGMTKYKIFLALYTRRMSCLGPSLERGAPWKEESPLPSCWGEKESLPRSTKHVTPPIPSCTLVTGMACSTPPRSIRRVLSGSVLICKEASALCSKSCRGLSASCEILPLLKNL